MKTFKFAPIFLWAALLGLVFPSSMAAKIVWSVTIAVLVVAATGTLSELAVIGFVVSVASGASGDFAATVLTLEGQKTVLVDPALLIFSIDPGDVFVASMDLDVPVTDAVEVESLNVFPLSILVWLAQEFLNYFSGWPQFQPGLPNSTLFFGVLLVLYLAFSQGARQIGFAIAASCVFLMAALWLQHVLVAYIEFGLSAIIFALLPSLLMIFGFALGLKASKANETAQKLGAVLLQSMLVFGWLNLQVDFPDWVSAIILCLTFAVPELVVSTLMFGALFHFAPWAGVAGGILILLPQLTRRDRKTLMQAASADLLAKIRPNEAGQFNLEELI